MDRTDIGLRVAVGPHVLDFLDLGQDAWVQTLRAGRLELMESTSVLIWSALSQTASVVVDVGGFNGLYAMLAAKSGPATVFAFEPVALSYGTLVLNLRLNQLDGAVVAVNCALGSNCERAIISSQFGPYVMASGESLVQETWPYSFPVEVQRFDAIWRGEVDTLAWPPSTFGSPVDLIKVDVEGFEARVLAGMRETIFRDGNKPHILVELLTSEAVANFLPGLPPGYRCYRIHEGSPELTMISAETAITLAGGNFLLSTMTVQDITDLEIRVQGGLTPELWSNVELKVD
jgi:FkbM family methyltransferase